MAAAADELDYDDIICQNILIRKDEPQDNTSTVEVVKKESEDFESQYNRQAAIYQMDENEATAINTYLEQTLYESDSDKSTSEGSDFEPAVEPVIPSLSDLDDLDSSDSDWEVAKKAKVKETYDFHCDECEKKFTTNRGMLIHKKAHTRKREKELNTNEN